MKRLLSFGLSLVLTLACQLVLAQTEPPADTSSFADFDSYGDAGDGSQGYATQKVLYLSPTKLISVGFEGQTPFDWSTNDDATTTEVERYSGLRLGANIPVISRNDFILNLGVSYWETAVGLGNTQVRSGADINRVADAGTVGQLVDRGLRSTGINATVFKPFNIKNFLIVQAQADLNGTYRNLAETNTNGLTFSGVVIYGWKRSDSLMWGVGVTRTYRAGQVLHIPVLMYNRTYNQRWGVEVLFPARANVRRNFSPNSLLMAGYEIEGNAYFLGRVGGEDLYLRRGELKPRLTYEQKLFGFVWLSTQVGYRHNWRFDVYDRQNPDSDNTALLENDLKGAFYFNVGLNLVSP